MTITRALTRCCCLVVIAMLAPTLGAAVTRSAGCGKTLASGTYQMTDQAVTRTYRLFVPSGYKPSTAYPLVMVFHGWGGDENEFLGDRDVTTLANKRGYIVAAPRGLGSATPDSNRNSWSFRGSTTALAGPSEDGASYTPETTAGPICDPARTPNYTYPSCRNIARNTCSWTQCQADDVAFTITLVTEIESKLCVDTTRVFASGGSNGGMFTWELGQNTHSAPIFRAIAPIIGLPHRGYLDMPGRSGGMPVLVITGMQDTTVPPGAWEDTSHTTSSDGDRYYYTGASAITQRWGIMNSCPYTNMPAVPFNARTTRADCRTYCASNAAGWSGGSAGTGWPNVLDCRAPMGHTYDFGWSWKLILDFFDAHSK
jgi:poly(3-hydroxybutyrate) depolymerase